MAVLAEAPSLYPLNKRSGSWASLSLTDELARRYALLAAAKNDAGLQRHLNARCAIDPVFWFDNFAYTYDPRRKPSKLPFVLFPVQESYIRGLEFCLRHSLRSRTEKSRDMGVTWLNTGFDVHHALYEDGYKAGIGSRKEDLIDRSGDPDSIFWKARFLLNNLPFWMLPESFETAHMRIVIPGWEFNPTGGSITGEAGINIGRGGRNGRYTVDEFAHVANPKSIEASLSDNTDCRNDTSTPYGPGGPFAERRDEAVDWQGEDQTPTDAAIINFRLHWRDHPEKNEEWYEKKKKQLGDPLVIAQELDIDYNASIAGIIIPAGWVNPANGRALYENEVGAICIGGDVAEDGADNSAAVVREGRNIFHAEEWHGHELTETTGKFIQLGLTFEKWLAPGHKLYFQIDKVGVGAGVVSNLRTYARENGKKSWVIIGIQAGESAPEMDPACLRLKDWLWWNARKFFEAHAPAIDGEIDPGIRKKLCRELSSPTYIVNLAGKVVTESKAQMKARGVASPNLADALIHTFLFEPKKPKPKDTPKWASPPNHRHSRVG